LQRPRPGCSLCGVSPDLIDRLCTIRDLHELGGARLADANLILDQRLPLCPIASVTGLERFEVLASGDVMLVGFFPGICP
jgi:hypothetical protein